MDTAVQLVLTLMSLMGVMMTAVGLPGLIVILVTLLIYGVYVDFSEPTMWVYITIASVALFATFIDNLATVVGARKFGASKYGMMGAFIGGLIGFFLFPPIGALIGSFVGAFLVDLINKKNPKKALYSATGTMVGCVTGIFIKLFIAMILFGWLMFIVW